MGMSVSSCGPEDNALLSELRKQARMQPASAQAHSKLGRSLHAIGALEEAIRALKLATRLDPGNAQFWNDLGAALHSAKRFDEARTALAQALTLNPDLGTAQYNLGCLWFEKGLLGQAHGNFLKAAKVAPCVEYEDHLARCQDGLVPQWHFPMLHDERRNKAYRQAIEEIVHPGMTVLEIGTGSGLLAMMAARAGARVVTCESVGVIAERARKVVAANGLADRISVVPKKSTELEVGPGKDLEMPADALVSEILGGYFLGEEVLTSIDDARRRLLKRDAPMVPMSGSVMTALVSERGLKDRLSVDTVEGFDLSAFNELAPLRLTVPMHADLQLLTEPAQVTRIDFKESFRIPAMQTLKARTQAEGLAVGAVLWMRIDLTERMVLENRPPEGLKMHWPIKLFRFRNLVKVQEETVISLHAGCDGAQFWIWP